MTAGKPLQGSLQAHGTTDSICPPLYKVPDVPNAFNPHKNNHVGGYYNSHSNHDKSGSGRSATYPMEAEISRRLGLTSQYSGYYSCKLSGRAREARIQRFGGAVSPGQGTSAAPNNPVGVASRGDLVGGRASARVSFAQRPHPIPASRRRGNKARENRLRLHPHPVLGAGKGELLNGKWRRRGSNPVSVLRQPAGMPL